MKRIEKVSVTATEVQNEFDRVLNAVAQGDLVVITKHNTPRAVLMSIDKFDALSRAEEAALNALSDEFDALLEDMQTRKARAGVRRALGASPEELGKAAVSAAKRRRDR